jgi:hypothetical protein
MALQGHKANVKITGDPVAITDEATTDLGAHTV